MRYIDLVRIYEELEHTSKRLGKTFILSRFLKIIPDSLMEQTILLLQGRIFPSWDQREIGVAARILLKALNIASGKDANELEILWKKTGDLGEVAELIIKNKSQMTLFSASLSIDKVFDNLQKLASLEGEGTVDRKVKIIAELLTSASSSEAKYIIRTITGDLRVGLGEGTLRDGIIWCFFGKELEINYDKDNNELIIDDEKRSKYNNYVEMTQEAFDLTNDFAEVIALAKKGVGSLKDVSMEPGKPINVMRYQKAQDINDAFDTVGRPAAFEFKYDGFLVQIARRKDKVWVFTRRLENVSNQFPDIIDFVKKYVDCDDFIIEAEAVGFDFRTKKYCSFQSISQRIKRKYNIKEISEKFPVEVNVFDVIFFKGKNLIKTPFKDRRKIVEKIVNVEDGKIKPAVQIITSDEKEAQLFYETSLKNGNEGIMAKNLDAVYKPGSRVGYGVKIKPVMESLDVVVIGAEWGEGKRSDWLSSFSIACYDDKNEEFVEIGKVATGLKEKDEEGVSFSQMTKLLKSLIIKEKGREVVVKPKIVIEVSFEEIQKSPTYTSGFALRFPRFTRLRDDKSVSEISTLKEVVKAYDAQRGRGKQ